MVWPFCLRQTLGVVAMVSTQGQSDDELLALGQRINELSFAAKYSEVVPLRHRYLELIEARQGTDTLAEAELVLRRAVAIHEKERDDALTPQAVHNLVRLLRDTNRHAQADELVRSWSRR
jgi:hypothetical protein